MLGALRRGARNAVMVSVACAAAGIIVGMVTLTGMGLKFSSLVIDLSFGIKALAILLIGAASLVLGMGLPVTASYIVLATLAGPALLDMGVPLLVSPHDRLLVLPGCQRNPSGEPGQFRRRRDRGGQSDADRFYVLEARQGTLHHPPHHGLPTAAGDR